MDLKLKGKVALVTGAARGMGAATSIGLAREGVKIAALDIAGKGNNGFGTKSQLEDTVNTIKELGVDAVPIYADLTIEDEVISAVNEVEKRFGKIDILINCVGFVRFGLVKDISYEDWKKMFEINTHAHFLACKYTVPIIIKQRWGRIINISSNIGLRGVGNFSGYCASKFAVIGLTQALANELGEFGITVNAVCPGATNTEFAWNQVKMLNTTKEEFNKMALARNIIQEWEEPEDIANTIIFLCSDRAKFITGASFLVDGGSMVKM